jgi:hypothetical protein
MSSQSGQPETQSLCLQAREHWAGGRSGYALRDALAARRGDPQDLEAKLLLAGLVAEFPARSVSHMRADVLALLRDPDIAPEYICCRGWLLLVRDAGWNAALTQAECRRLARGCRMTHWPRRCCARRRCGYGEAERVLTRLRRWLLLSGEWQHHPRLVHDLAVQAELNGGAWPFSDAEREALKQEAAEPLRPLICRAPMSSLRTGRFRRPRDARRRPNYERWPYPAWRRLMAIEADQAPARRNPRARSGAPETIPLRANVLIAAAAPEAKLPRSRANIPTLP